MRHQQIPPVAGLDTRLAPAKDGLLARILACCSCMLVRSVTVVPGGGINDEKGLLDHGHRVKY